MAKYITEILDEINENSALITEYAGNAAIRIVFENAFLPENRFILPEGEPPYKPDPAPIGMSPANLYQELRKLHIFRRADLTELRRESLFVQLLEALHPSEAKLMLAIKDQDIGRLYPNLTWKLGTQVGWLPEELQEIAPKVAKKAAKKAAKKIGAKHSSELNVSKPEPDSSTGSEEGEKDE